MNTQKQIDAILRANKTSDRTELAPLTPIDQRVNGAIDAQYADDTETYKANGQSTLNAGINSIGKNLLKTGVRLLDNVIGTSVGTVQGTYGLLNGLVNPDDDDAGIVDRISGAFGKGLDGFIDNEYSKNVTDKALEGLDKAIPVYESKEDRESGTPVANVKTFDKVMDGLSFMGAAWAGGEARLWAKGTKLGVKASKFASQLMKQAEKQGFNAANPASSLYKEVVEATSDLFKNPTAKNFGEKMAKFGFNSDLLWGEMSEAGIEARETKRTIERQITDDFVKSNNGQPLNDEQKKIIKDRSESASAWNFATNLAVLKGTDYIGKGLLSKNKWIDDVVDLDSIKLKKQAGKLSEATVNESQSIYKRLYQTSKNPIVSGLLTEPVQEFAQFASNDFLVNLYTNKNPNNDNANEYYVDAIESAFPALKKLGTNALSREAIESVMIGGLIGGAGGAVGQRGYSREKGELKARTDKYIEFSNTINKKAELAIGQLANSKSTSMAMDGAVANGDRLTYETLKDHDIINYVQNAIKSKNYKEVVSDFQDIKDMPVDEFNKVHGTDIDAEKKTKLADSLLYAAEKIKGSTDKLMANNGSKLFQLEQDGNPDIIPFLIKMDLFHKNISDRETQFIKEFQEDGVDYMAFSKKAITDEMFNEKQKGIAELYNQVEQVEKSEIPLAEKVIKKKELSDKILTLNKDLQTAITDKTYKEEFARLVEDNKRFKENKKAGESAFSDDLVTPTNPSLNVDQIKKVKDFIAIQEAKEKLQDSYAKILGDEKEAKKIQKQIDYRNQEDKIQQLFTVNGKVRAKTEKIKETVDGKETEVEKSSEREFEFVNENDKNPEGYVVNEMLREGEYYQLYSKIYRQKGKDDKARIYEPVKITRLELDSQGRGISGKVHFTTSDGKKGVRDSKQFIKDIKPSTDKRLAMPFDKDSKDFFEKFGSRAIKMMVGGQEKTGFLKPGYYDWKKNKIDAFNYNFVYEEDGKLKTKFGLSSKSILANYTSILDEKQSVREKLRLAIRAYIDQKMYNDENGDIRFTAFSGELKSITNTIGKLKSDIEFFRNTVAEADRDKLVEHINADIVYYETKKQLLDEAIEYFNEFVVKDADVTNISDDKLREAIERIEKYKEAKTVKEKKQILEAGSGAINDQLQINNELKDQLDELRDSLIAKVTDSKAKSYQGKLLEGVQQGTITQAEYTDYQTKWNDYLAKSAESSSKYYDELGDDAKDIKQKEDRLLTNFIANLTDRGFEYSTSNNKLIVVPEYKSHKSARLVVRKSYAERKAVATITGNYDTRLPDQIPANNGEQQFFEELTKNTLKDNPRFRVLRFSDVKANHPEIYANLDTTERVDTRADGTTFAVKGNRVWGDKATKQQQDDLILIVNVDTKGEFRKIGSNYIISNYAESKANKHLTEQRVEIQKLLNDGQEVFTTIKPETIWYGGVNEANYSNELKPFSEKQWGASDDYKEGYLIPDKAESDANQNLEVGTLYYRPENSNTHIPLSVKKIGNLAVKVYNKTTRKTQPINIGDNFVNALEFFAQSKDVEEFNQFANQFSSLFVYGKFLNVEFDPTKVNQYNQTGVYLVAGNTTIDVYNSDGKLNNDAIKEAVSNTLFNPSLKMLQTNPTDLYLRIYPKDAGKPFSQIISGKNNRSDYYGLLEQVPMDTYADRTQFRNGTVELNDVGKVSKKEEVKKDKKEPDVDEEEDVNQPKPFAKKASDRKKSTGTETDSERIKREAIEEVRARKQKETEVKQPTEEIADDQPKAFANKAVPRGKKIEESIKPGEVRKTGRMRLLAVDKLKGYARPMTSAELIEAKERLKAYNIDVDILTGLIDNKAYGATLKSGDVLLSDKAVVGTDYHEEFHVVTEHILTPEELEDMYAEQQVKYPKLNRYDLNEELAEQFRLFAKGYRGFSGKIVYYFNKILNWLRGYKQFNKDRLLNELFKKIADGDFIGRPVRRTDTVYYKLAKEAGQEIRVADKRKIFSELSAYLVDELAFHYTDKGKGDKYSFLNDHGNRNRFLSEKFSVKDEDDNDVLDEKGKVKTKQTVDSLFDFFFSDEFALDDNLDSIFQAHKEDLRPDFEKYVKKMFGISVSEQIEQQEIENEQNQDENKSSASPVRIADNEHNHGLDAIKQLNLLSAFMRGSGGEATNIGDFVGFVYNNINLSSKFEDYKNNFKELKEKSDNKGFDEIIDFIDELNTYTESDNVDKFNLSNNLFNIFSKQEYKFISLKELNDGKLTFLDLAHSGQHEEVKNQFKSEFRENIIPYIKSNQRIDSVEEFYEVMGLADFKMPANFEISDINGTSGIIQAINKEIDRVVSLGKKEQFDVDGLFNFSTKENKLGQDGRIGPIVDKYISDSTEGRLFSLYNAEGNSQYALVNHTSLSKAMEDFDSEFSSTVVLSGLQKQGTFDIDGKPLTKATEEELHLMTIEGVLEKGIIPYIFNGDKSTAVGLVAKNKNSLLLADIHEIFAEEMTDLFTYNSLKDTVSIGNTSGNQYNAFMFGYLSEDKSELGDKYKEAKELLASVTDRGVVTPIVNGVFSVKNNEKTINFTYDELVESWNEEVGKRIQGYKEIFGTGYTHSQLADFVTMYAVGTQKQQALVGKMYFYKDPTKRTSAWNSAKTNINEDSNSIEQYMNVIKPATHFDPTQGLRSVVTTAVADLEDQSVLDKKGYAFGDADDAQAHMTAEAWRFTQVQSGQWNGTLDRAFNELERHDDLSTLTEQELDKINKSIFDIREQMSVSKLQYYYLRKDEKTGVLIPTFYKYSVVPLFKVLTKGKNLDKLRQFMETNNIHQHMAETSNKVGMNKTPIPKYQPVIEDGKIVDYVWNELLTDGRLINDDYIQSAPWKGLGIQVQMPYPHDTVTFGSQVRKLITEDLDGEYTFKAGEPNKTAKEIRDKYDGLIEEKVKADLEKFKKQFDLDAKLGLAVNTETGLVDKTKFKEALIDVATSRDVTMEFVNQLNKLDQLDIITAKSKLQAMINSMVRNKVINQKLSGDAKAMMSSVGFEKDSISYDNRLKFYEYDENGHTKGLEVFVPLDKQYESLTHIDNETGMYEWNDDVPDELKTIIGYRIPTQSQASIEKIYIKAFMPPHMKNVVVVPFELTKKAGSDFDIDKLNMFYPKIQKGKLADSIDNKIIQFYADLLGSPQMRETMLGTIDNTQIRDLAVDLREARTGEKAEKERGWKLSDPMYAVKRRISFLEGKYALGITALHGAHHAEAQKTGLAFNNETEINGVKLSDLLQLLTGKEGWIENRNGIDVVPLDKINALDGHKISDYLSQLINACVDVAKDDYITAVNYKTETSGLVCALLRIGVEPEAVFNMLTDKSVIDYVAKEKSSKAKVGSFTDKKVVKNLRDNAKKNSPLWLYLRLSEFSNKLNGMMQASNFDTKGNGKTIEENELMLLRTQYYENKGSRTINVRKELTKVSELEAHFVIGDQPMKRLAQDSFIESMKDIALNANNFSSIVFETTKWFLDNKESDNNTNVGNLKEKYTKVLKAIYSKALPDSDGIAKESTADATKNASKFKNTLLSYMMQVKIMNVMKKNNRVPLTEIGKILVDTPSQIRKAQATSENKFLNTLSVLTDVKARRDTANNYSLIYNSITVKNTANLITDEMSELQESFADLYGENPELAKNIAIFSIFQSGVVQSPISINNMIPLSIMQEVLGTTNPNLIDELTASASELKASELNDMIDAANPLLDSGKQNTIYSRIYDPLIVAEVNKIKEERCAE